MWQTILNEAGSSGSAQRQMYYDHLEECFQRNFLVPLKGEMIPLGASAYLRNDQMQESRMTFFEGLYLEFSFDWRNVFAGTRGVWPNEPEHAVLILTMLAIISQQIATAMEDSDRDARLPRYLQLLREVSGMAHLWLTQCFARVASEASENFYRFFGTFMAEFLSMDQELWDLAMSA
jgi:TorA maturation chaperone TorD